MAQVFDDRPCDLGEGPLWHPERQMLFWFDITACRMLARDANGPHAWSFDEMHSAAGWVDRDTLILASETGLWRFGIETGARTLICPLEADNPVTRSNDGRADPQGGFWIGTIGKAAEPRAGSIWRWYRGELRQLFTGLTITNAISFAPDGQNACFTDTKTARVMRVALDAQGWPAAEPELLVDLSPEGLNPDGAVFDAEGLLWIAQWGASRVAAYGPNGQFVRAVTIDAPHASCPAFGGPDLDTLYCTTAREGLGATQRAAAPQSGMVFAQAGVARGQAENRVVL
ncbi:SMP-30/gluconolactonase/LRE family protein [Pararhodobacter marinus]|uniref:SMP-30/gluconolactonase/LRE family protein n=1 Tax=Pararhodobacter marinus TaxID=2184063 RepID=UPI003514B3B0